MFAMLEEWPRDDHEGLAAVWKRLEILLETHAEAEEQYFYPELLRIGTGGADAESVEEEVEDAVKDHNDIRSRVRKVGRCRTGSTRGGRRSSTPTSTTATTWARRSARTSPTSGSARASSCATRSRSSSCATRRCAAAEGITPKDKDPKRYVAAKKRARPPPPPEGRGHGEEGAKAAPARARPVQEVLARRLRGVASPARTGALD